MAQALRSIFAQQNVGRIHILVGVDRAEGDIAAINPIFQEQPDNCVTTLVNLGYSTSTRHGGIHAAGDGGALRTILSYMANSRYVAYLDDDNWLAPDHLEKLL
ncbi:MAG TPA: glycosyltransferase family 2 protein, partial [Rhodospirillaceae bacterium]|nr:glycosyltransferase family 2 protein [Rhodospirillaceae bacterium]